MSALDTFSSNNNQMGGPDSIEIATKFITMFSISIQSYLFGIKICDVKFKYLTYSKWLAIILYIMSWAFLALSGILSSMNNGNSTSCLLSQVTCNFFYFTTKLIIYLWFIEKVRVVSGSSQQRWRSSRYIFHLSLLGPYFGVFVLMVMYEIHKIDETDECIIGLALIASVPLLVYDFLITAFMAMLFIKPLMVAGKNIRGNWKHSRLHRVAMRTFIASIISLIASFANIIWLAVYHDGQRDVICLTSCAIDVTINVVTIHWVTTNPKKSPENNRSMPAKITKNTGSGLPITSPFSDFVDSQKSRFSTMTMELEAHNRSDDFHCPIDIMSNTSEQQARTFQTAHVNDTTLPTISSVAPQHPRNPSIPESAYRNDARL